MERWEFAEALPDKKQKKKFFWRCSRNYDKAINFQSCQLSYNSYKNINDKRTQDV